MPSMFLDQQNLALGPQRLAEFSFRGTNIDGKNSKLVFTSQLPARSSSRVSATALPWRRGRRRRRARLHRLGGLNTDKSACPALILHRCALRRRPLALRAGPSLRTTASGRGAGEVGGRPCLAARSSWSLGRVRSSRVVSSWSFGGWRSLTLVRRSRGRWGEHVVVAVVAPIEMGAGGSVPEPQPWRRPVCE